MTCSHAYESTGLDTIHYLDLDSPKLDWSNPNVGADGMVLCSTRECVYCRKEQATVYGTHRTVWRNVKREKD